MQDSLNKKGLTAAEKCGIFALFTALLCALINLMLAVIPLILFLLLCLVAPFFPQFSFYLPIISRGKNRLHGGVALTFDDGPSPLSTPIILKLLNRHGLTATFFVVGQKAAKYPHLIQAILNQGHSLGNHSWRHDYLLMLRSSKKLHRDIHNTQEVLKTQGGQTHFFRPPLGITNSRLASVLAEENLVTVNFSCRAFDRGNKNIHRLAAKIIQRLQPGGIIMLHDLPPYHPEQTAMWQQELDLLFTDLAALDTVISLQELACL